MKFPLFDAHCDTISEALIKHEGFCRNDLHWDLGRAEAYRPCAQFFAIFALVLDSPDELEPAHQALYWRRGRDAFDAQYGKFAEELDRNQARMTFCRSAADAEAAAAAGKIGAFLSVEGGEILDCSIESLERAYGMGVRAVNLTWNYENALSGSNVQGADRGLTEPGREFVRRCQELGVIVDLSHTSDPGFWDVMEMAARPVMASHSNARALWNHTRNLTDDMFRAIIKNGGVAGINLYTDFLDADPDVDTVVRHIEHFLDLGGAKHICMGGDLDGCDTLPRGIRGNQDIWKIGEALLKKNYTEELICDIFYNNLLRVVKSACAI